MKTGKLSIIIALILTAVLLLGTVPAYAAPSDAIPERSAFINTPLKVPAAAKDFSRPGFMRDPALPSAYSSVDAGVITTPKNQGDYGTCWTFAATAMAEASLLSYGGTYGGGLIPDVDTINFSETQLAYFTYQAPRDPLHNLDGDSISCSYPDWRDIGGNHYYSTFALASWKGLATEDEAPSYESLLNNVAPDADAASLASIRLTDSYIFSMTDTASVKKAIRKNGAVGTGYYHSEEAQYENSENGAYYYPEAINYSNHSITLVGWDDNYSATNFTTIPPQNGAWLVKNSWGTDWGNGGYGWISYCDGSIINQDAFAMKFTDSSTYDNNYQYDGTINLSYISLDNGDTVVNMYEACASDYERIDAVSFAVFTPGLHYSVQLMSGDSYTGDEEAFLLSEPVTGVAEHAGYYTVRIDEAPIVRRGDVYGIVIAFETPDGSPYYVFADTSAANGDITLINSNEGEYSSVFYPIGQGRLGEMNLTESGYTARIKGFTTNVAPLAFNLTGLDADADEFIRIGMPYSFTLTPDADKSLPASISITSGGQVFTDYSYSSSTGEVVINSAAGELTVTASSETLYALTVDGTTTYHAAGETVDVAAERKFYSEDDKGFRFLSWDCELVADKESAETTVTMPAADLEINPVYMLVGDIDANGRVTGTDSMMLKIMLLNDVGLSQARCDIDGNGRMTATDIMILKLILLGVYVPTM